MKLSTTVRVSKQDIQYSPNGLTLRLNSISYRKVFLSLAYHVERYGNKTINIREATDEEYAQETLWKLNKDDVFFIITVDCPTDALEHTE